QHLLEHREGDTRLVAQARHIAVAGVEWLRLARGGRERIVAAGEIADASAESSIGPRGAELLDPRVFVRRHRLRGQLAADPVGLLSEDHAPTSTGGGEGRGAAAGAAADDDDISLALRGRRRPGEEVRLPCQRRGAGQCEKGATLHDLLVRRTAGYG